MTQEEKNQQVIRVSWNEIHIYRLNDGKIAEHWVELSMLELLQQIGALPQPC
jgi:predicted ester cyclase